MTTIAATTAKRKNKACVRDMMSPFARGMYHIGVTKLFYDGSRSVKYLLRWYHPVSWLLWVLFFIPCLFTRDSLLEMLPARLPKFWRHCKDRVQWVNLDTPCKELRRPIYRLLSTRH